MKQIYALNLITEESTPLEQLLPIVEAAVKGGVTIVQLREKRSLGKYFYEKAQSVKALLDRYNIPLIINDRIDIALAVGAAGVHVGQEDLPLAAIRKIVPPSMIVGVSASTLEEALESERNGASYIGVGSIFATKSKADATLLPEGELAKIAQSVSIPIMAIGGITLNNMQQLAGAELAGVAVVSAIMKAEDPYAAAMAFREMWQ